MLLRNTHYMALLPIEFKQHVFPSKTPMGRLAPATVQPAIDYQEKARQFDANMFNAGKRKPGLFYHPDPDSRIQPKQTHARKPRKQAMLLLTDGKEVVQTAPITAY